MHQLRLTIKRKHLCNLSDCKGMSYDHARHRAITKLITIYFCLPSAFLMCIVVV